MDRLQLQHLLAAEQARRQRASMPQQQGLLYEQPSQQSSSGGFNPMQAANTYNQIAPMWGGQPLWGGSSAAGGSGASSMLASAGPWAALAAAVVGNETYQNKEGNRPNDFTEHMGDIATGKVLERDLDKYVGDWAGDLAKPTTPSGMWRMSKDLFDFDKGLLSDIGEGFGGLLDSIF